MSDEEQSPEAEAEKKSSPVGTLIFGVIGAVVMGGVALGVVMIAPSGSSSEATACIPEEELAAAEEAEELKKSLDDIAFVDIGSMVITLGPKAKADHLKISITLETTKDQVKTAEHLKPRFKDVLNTYLRAVDESDLTQPVAMTRLRSQMLRRLQVAASKDVVADVLVTDFILN